MAAKALAKAADDRYASAQAFVAALDAAAPRRPSMPMLPEPAVGHAGPSEVTAALDRLVAAPRGRTVAGVGPDPAKRAATPVAGVPQPRGAIAGFGEEWAEPQSPPGTFLGISMTPRPGSLRAETVQRALAQAASPDAVLVGAPPAPPAIEPPVPPTISPPATPSPARPPLGRWRWQRRKLVIPAGVAVLGGLIVVAIVASHGDHPPPSPAAPVAAPTPPPAPTTDPAAELIARANELAAQGNRDAAIDLLARGHRQFPDRADLSFTAGKLYFARYYWSDGLKSFRDAVRSDPRYRADPELIKTVLRGFLITPGYNDDLADFLHDDIGAAARPYLEETARDHPSLDLRRRAAAELGRYH